MLHKVSLGTADIEKYRMLKVRSVIDEIVSLGNDLKGLRLCHISSTPFGGGVAELLSCYIPLVRALGIKIDWQVIRGDRRFFTVTKALHNALQGATFDDINKESTRKEYQNHNLANARELDLNYDVFIVNDPQPATIYPTTTPNGYGVAMLTVQSRMRRCGVSCALILKSMMRRFSPPGSLSPETLR